MTAGDGTEKIVPREEAPVDVNAKAGPRVVLAPMNPNGNLPPLAGVAPAGPPPAAASNGTLPNSEPRKIKTLTVHGDQAEGAAAPVTPVAPAPAPLAKPTPAARTSAAPATRSPPTAANASANAPLSLTPQASQPAPAPEPRRIAATNPAQTEPSAPASSGGYMVSVSSQLNEAAAQASYKALQGKYPAVLGAHEAVIKRADAGEKGVRYRAMVGPFGSSEEARQFCGSLQSAGGQCWVQRN
jgi:hypothetical protein